ncbi:indolepyruvate oxidoreductase subunit beta [Bacillota bacterium LX-D]|nr:indolepyruvate oxidoreductase subunit beta [Bacillota bacterium LX-D]
MKEVFNIIIAGVGGQGNVLASRILARAAMEQRLHVRTSEAIGMAQREGSVSSQVRIGVEDVGPLVPDQKADLILGLELAETVRALPKLKTNGLVISNTATILPISVALGKSTYNTEELLNFLKAKVQNIYLLNATALANRAGTYKAANIVLLGALAALNKLPFSGSNLLEVIFNSIPPKLHDINRTAFTLGVEAMGGRL